MSGLVGGGEGVMYSNVQLSDGYTRLAKTGLGRRSTVDNLFCNFLAGNNESLFFFGDRQEEQNRAKHRYFGHTSNDARQKCQTRELCGWLTWLIATTRWSGLCVASIDEWQAKQ